MRSTRVVMWLLGAVAAPGLAQPSPGTEHAARFIPTPGVKELSGRLLVRPVQPDTWIQRGLRPRQAAARTAAARLMVQSMTIGRVDAPDVSILLVPAGQDERSLATMLLATGEFEFAEPDWIVYPCDTTPDDPAVPGQWHLRKIQAHAAWDLTTCDGAITCAFVDTGVDLTHPDLTANLVPGYNAVTHLTQIQGGAVSDVSGHGTEVAGAAAASGNNGLGGSGVAWDLKVMPVRASNWSSGAAFLSDIILGASWAAANGAKVVSISYAGVETNSAEAVGASIMDQNGGLLFWAAGNGNISLSTDWPHVIVVGSTDSNDVKAPDSNYGPAIDVVAPGQGIYTTQRQGAYGWVSGTSYAAPIAAATAALAWSQSPTLSCYQVMARLSYSCNDLGAPGEDDIYGAGRVNAYRMARMTSPEVLNENGPAILPALSNMVQAAPGLRAQYYALPHHLPSPWSFAGMSPTGWAIVPDFEIPHPTPVPGFGADFSGLFRVDEAGAYTFRIQATDGAIFLVDGVPVTAALSLVPGSTRSGTVRLARGLHTVRCVLYSGVFAPSLAVWVRGRGLGDNYVPISRLLHETTWDDPRP